MVKQAKQERNIHCTVCGKAYCDPVAAKIHAHKHRVRAQLALVMVIPQSTGAMAAKTTSLPGPTSDTCPVRQPPSLRIRQVAAPPVIQSRATKGFKKRQKVRPGLGKKPELLPLEHEKQVRLRVRKHTADGHDVSSNVTDRLTKKRAKIAKNKRRLALTYSPIVLSDDEGQCISEDEIQLATNDEKSLRYEDEESLPYSDDESHLYVEDESHSSSEGEQPPSPNYGKEEQSAWGSFIDYLRLFF